MSILIANWPTEKVSTWRKAGMVHSCVICGTEFMARMSNARYCSERCRHHAQARRRLSREIEYNNVRSELAFCRRELNELHDQLLIGRRVRVLDPDSLMFDRSGVVALPNGKLGAYVCFSSEFSVAYRRQHLGNWVSFAFSQRASAQGKCHARPLAPDSN